MDRVGARLGSDTIAWIVYCWFGPGLAEMMRVRLRFFQAGVC